MPYLSVLNRNEDTSQYFEKVFAALKFVELLKRNSSLSRIEIKPDRKQGEKRRVEDLTLFFENSSVEVIQLKYTDSAENSWNYCDLWQKKETIIKNEGKRSPRYEGMLIFKFLKSWRYHNGLQKIVKLSLVSNKPLGDDLKIFFDDVEKLREGKITWKVFSSKYNEELEDIKANFLKIRLEKGELEAFVRSLVFKKSKDNRDLDCALEKELNVRGISDKDRIDAFIARTFRKFTQPNISVRKADVEELLEIIKIGLVHQINTPKNYIQRIELEAKILEAVETQRIKGGFVFLFAPSGSGKTVLLSNLTQKCDDFIPYLCRIRPFEKANSTYNYEKERLSSIWFKVDLIQRFFELGLTKERVSIKDNEDYINLVFGRTLYQLSESALKRRSKKIVIIVDALDQVETDNYKGKSILSAIPNISYPGVVFLLSTWGEKYLPPQISGKKISVNLAFNESEIKHYFLAGGIRLTNDQINKIVQKTKGLAISLLYLIQKFKKISRDDYDGIIDEQYEYKEVFDWYRPIWDSLNKQQKHCLGCLSFHFEEVQKDKLFQVAGIGLANFSILNEKISPFVSVKNGYIEPYHDSFRRFIISKLKGFRNDYHKKIIKFYVKPENSKLPYTRKYSTMHLSAVGINDLFIETITNKLIKRGFIEDIFASRMDYISKIDVAKYFVRYFNIKGDLKNFIKYAIQTSNIGPVINDDEVFLKAKIGTANLLKEVEGNLSTIKNDSIHTLRDWVLKRIRVGNLLKRNGDLLSENIANRFLEDGLARISFNRDILWAPDFLKNTNEHWESFQEYLEANLNLGRYQWAAERILNIRFKEPKPFMVGFRAGALVALNRIQYLKNKKTVLDFLKKLPQSLQLITYGYLYLEQKDSAAAIKLRNLLKKPVLYKYLSNDKYKNQNLDLAEAAFILKIGNYKFLIRKLIQNLQFDPPYHRNTYSFWGMDNKNFFLKKAALLSIIEDSFDEKSFYIGKLKEHNGDNYKDYNNDSFATVVAMNILLVKNIILIKDGSLKWGQFKEFLCSNLNVFKNEILKANEVRRIREYPLCDTAYVYYQNTNFFIGDSLHAVAEYFPKYLESFVVDVETTFKNTILENNPSYLETILEQLLPLTPTLREKIGLYEKKVFNNKIKDKLGNIEKKRLLKRVG